MPAATACASRGAAPGARRTTACPECSTPVRPRIACHRAVAFSGVCGLPSTSPSSSNIESPPMTMPSKSGMSSREPRRDIGGLAAREQQHVLVGREGAALGGLDRRR